MKDPIKVVADRLDIPEYKVRTVINHYFKSVKEEMTNPTKPAILLANFGMLSIQSYKIPRFIKSCIDRIRIYGKGRNREEKLREYWNIREVLIKYGKYNPKASYNRRNKLIKNT